jgi:hypothetical protein
MAAKHRRRPRRRRAGPWSVPKPERVAPECRERQARLWRAFGQKVDELDRRKAS